MALNYYHPVVRWIAGRLQLQQEQAADALAARFAGGRASYLVALSRLALKQDGRSLCWPAREFLPVRGTLIRRIAMLRRSEWDGNDGSAVIDGLGASSRPVTLLGLTLGVATLRGPARGGEGEEPAAATSNIVTTTTSATGTPFMPPYVQEGTAGLIAFRPAATFRRMDSDLILPLLNTFMGIDLSELPKQYKVIASKPGSLKLGVEDIEWVTGSIRFGRGKNNAGDVVHTFMLGGLDCPHRRRHSTAWRSSASGASTSTEPAMAGVSITNSRGHWREPWGPIPACACSTTGPSSSTRKRRSVRSWAGDHLNHRPTSGGRAGSGPAAGCSRSPSVTRTERSRNSTTWDGPMMR